MLKWVIAEGYGDARTMKIRSVSVEAWLANPQLMEANKAAQYHKVFEIACTQFTSVCFVARMIRTMRTHCVKLRAELSTGYSLGRV